MSLLEVLKQAAALPDYTARIAYLDKVLLVHPELRQELEKLIEELNLLQKPEETAAELSPEKRPTRLQNEADFELNDAEEPEIQVGEVIDNKYKILNRLGEGGMGVVYLVETIHDVRAQFALKLIKGRYASRQVLARFDQERQVLAYLHHPNIASFIDAGSVGPYQPYFVMEYVKGLPITRFCDKERLTLEERLELFKTVCRAVQHAHNKGIIHRDLKPGNLLVTLVDNKPVVKVIDFGVAKAIQRALTDKTLHSEINSIIGTLEYMAPEQAEATNLDIDTRADVYALGVVLYELLTGTLPFSRTELNAAAMLHLVDKICHEEPAKPSTKLSHSDSLPTVAANRRLEPAALMRKLRTEIDWIVMHCLEKERSRRYETANQLASDVDNYLRELPLIARPPSARYRLRKFIRRHRPKVLAASLLLLALVAGIIGTTWGMFKAHRAESMARNKAEEAQAINSFLSRELLRQADPGVQAEAGLLVDKEMKLREAVQRAGKLLMQGRFQNQPHVQAALHQTIGKTLYTLGDHAQAREHLQKAEELQGQLHGQNTPEHLESQLDLARVMLTLQQDASAEKLLREVLSRLQALSPTPPALTTQAHRLLARAVLEQARFEEARKLCEELQQRCMTEFGNDHPETARATAALAIAVWKVADKQKDPQVFAQAEPLFHQAEGALLKHLGPQHPDTLEFLGDYAVFCSRKGDLPQSERRNLELLNLFTQVLDTDHDTVLVTRNNLATVYFKKNQLDDALSQLEKVHQGYVRRYSPDYSGALAVRNGMAAIYHTQGKLEPAEQIYRECLAVVEKKHGPQSIYVSRYANQLAENLFRQGKLTEAEMYFTRVLELNSQVNPPPEPVLLENRLNLVQVYQKAGKHRQALEYLKQIRNSSYLERLPLYRQALVALLFVETLQALGEKAETASLLDRCLELLARDAQAQPAAYAPSSEREKLRSRAERLRKLAPDK